MKTGRETEWVRVTVVILIIMIAALFSGLAYSNSRTYSLTLVVAPVASGGYAGNQFAFYVLVNGKLSNSSDIVLPSNTLIKITIFEHATDLSPPFVDSAHDVLGTQFNRMMLFSNVIGPTSLNKVPDLSSGRYVMQVSPNDLSDTFSISNGVNIPVPPSSVVIAYITFNSPGTYSWGDMCNCGPSMDVQGEMYGNLTVV
ncbi:MAG: hypothetical protein M1518_02030 [Candidatus Thermoplasmatota archaeon]|jgi:heme/copper-type cytochrome/quinol oxidase subunit 2|nr:hypothetical protein [Candidatus Thermoplasmatota archaeon]